MEKLSVRCLRTCSSCPSSPSCLWVPCANSCSSPQVTPTSTPTPTPIVLQGAVGQHVESLSVVWPKAGQLLLAEAATTDSRCQLLSWDGRSCADAQGILSKMDYALSFHVKTVSWEHAGQVK